MKLSAVARLAIKILLFGTALTPLIYAPQLIFPFVLGKMFFYRGAVEIAFILTALLFIVEYVRGTANAPDSLASRLRARSVFFKNPLFIAIAVFVFSAAVSVALAPNVYRGFFGGGERGEGFLGIFHYFLFLALALVFFRMRDWAVFAGIWLGTASVVMLYAWLQFFSWFRLFGAASFPFALDATDQPGSWTGNPAYLAGYLIISLALALFLYNGSTHSTSSGQASSPRGLTSSRVWRALLIGFFAAVPATVVMTGIRGAVLGVFAGGFALAIGFLFQRGTKRSFKIAALGLLAGLVTLGGVFWMTRGAEVWKVFPGIRRLAKADLLSTPSVATRLLALTVSWEAFKERPLFGWGLENYDIAYNKYYDPAYAFYAEDWFDRAHNRFVDTAVTQGVFGLLSYLVVLGIMFRKFWDNIWTSDAHIFGGGRMSAPLLSAIFVAYIVQNLFIFDQITTYIAFFALAGILIYREGDGSASLPQATPPRTSSFPRFVSLVLCVVLGISVLASGYALYAWNFVPLRQAFRFHAVLSTKNGEKIFAATDSFFLPYTFIQAPLRARFIEILYNSDIIPKAQFAPLTNKALAALEETVAREPYEPRNLAALIESYNELAKQDPKFFAKSEEFARKAFALSPNRQGMRYHLSFVLSGMERYEEALALAKETLALDDRIAKAHYQLGLVYGLMAESRNYKGTMEGEAYRREAEREMDLALELGRKEIGTMRDYVGDLGARAALGTTQYYLFLESDLKNMVVFYRAWREPAKVTEVLEILIRYYPANKDYPHDAIVEYRTLRDKEGIIRNAEKLKKLQPSLAESLDIVIDLARKENWEILDTL